MYQHDAWGGRLLRSLHSTLYFVDGKLLLAFHISFVTVVSSRTSFQTGQDTEKRCKLFPVVLFEDSSDPQAFRQVLVWVHWFSSVCCATGASARTRVACAGLSC